MVAIYHVVYAHEGFDDAATKIFTMVKQAQARDPGKGRALYLDIEGHRNSADGFDRDMLELQQHFLLEFLMPYLTELHAPLYQIRNPNEQQNDLPDSLEIRPESSD
jgi:hypothetical protein